VQRGKKENQKEPEGPCRHPAQPTHRLFIIRLFIIFHYFAIIKWLRSLECPVLCVVWKNQSGCEVEIERSGTAPGRHPDLERSA